MPKRPSCDVIAENVKRARLARGWSQTELATRAKVAQSRVSEVENAVHRIRTETIDAIADALQVPPATLLIPAETTQTV